MKPAAPSKIIFIELILRSSLGVLNYNEFIGFCKERFLEYSSNGHTDEPANETLKLIKMIDRKQDRIIPRFSLITDFERIVIPDNCGIIFHEGAGRG